MEEQQIRIVTPDELLAEVIHYKTQQYRLVAISCTYKEGMEITYSFSKETELENLRLQIQEEEEVESITTIYPYAFLYENEMKELFGLKMKDISFDYENNLYRISEKTPFNRKKGDA